MANEPVDMKQEAIFRTSIAEPLEAVIGHVLRHIDYWLIVFDEPEFRVEDPNTSGLYAVRMEFAGSTLEITFSWDSKLRDGNAYHIQPQLVSDSTGSQAIATAENLTPRRADETTLWCGALSTQLTAVEVYGFRASPQVIRFVFPSTNLVVAIGYSGEPLLIGDGDEILVFPDEEWLQVKRTLSGPWTKLWECNVSSS